MASIADLNIRIGVAYRDLDRELRKVETRFRQTAQVLDGVANSMASAFTVPFLAIGGLAVKAAGDFEALRLAMETTMRDAGYSMAETRKELEALRKVALAPGIDLQQAVKGSIALQSVGFSAERARKTLVELANGVAAAGGSAEQLEGVVRQFAQISAKGKVMNEDLIVVKENLPSITKAMREAFGTTTAEGIRNAGISADQFIDGITKQLEKNARVQGGIKNAIDNTRSAITQFFAAIGDGINEAYNLNAVAQAMSDKIGKLVEMFKNLDPETKKSIFNFALYAAAIPAVIKAFGLLFGAGQQIIATIRLLGSGITNAGGLVLGFADKWSKLSAVMKFSYLGAAVAIIGALYLGFQKLSESTEQALHVTRQLESIEREANDAISEQKVQVQTLIGVLKDENRTKDEKLEAIKRLNAINPEYFGGLKLENGQVQGLTTSYDAYIANILKAARAKAAEGKLIEIDKKKIAAQEELNRLQSEAAKNKSSQFQQTTGGFGSVTAFEAQGGGAQKQFLEEAQRAVSSLENEEKAVRAVIEANVDLTSQEKSLAQQRNANEAKRNAQTAAQLAGEDAKKNKVKSVAQVYAEVNKELSDIQKKASALGSTGTDEAFDEFAKGIEKGVEKLVEAGAKIDGKEIQALRNLAKKGLGSVADFAPLPTGAGALGQVSSQEAAPQIADFAPKYDPDAIKNFKKDSALIGETLAGIKNGSISASEGFATINDVLAQTNESFAGTGLRLEELQFSFQSLGEGLSDLVEEFLRNGQAQEAMFEAVQASIIQLTNEGSTNLADFARAAASSAIKVAKAYAVQGIFAAVSKALQGLPFPVNLVAAAGAAGVAGALLNGLANRIQAPKLAKGGLAYGETLAMVGDNPNANIDPEVIAPLSKLKNIIGGGSQEVSVRGVISGNDLLILQDKARLRQKRTTR
jgi:tape measure domain-containing protein